MGTTTKPPHRPATFTSEPGNMPVPLSIDFPYTTMKTSSLIWVIGHICSCVQMNNMNMLTQDKIRDYLNTLNTRDIIWLRFRWSDKKVNYLRQNLQPPHELLVVVDLLKEQVHNRFEWIRIIQMCVPELMDKINA